MRRRKAKFAPRKLVCLETYWSDRHARAFGERFAQDFLKASGCRAIAGYATDVDWMESMLTDLLFLRRFYSDSDQWAKLRAIHESVLEDFAPARRLGLRLVTLRASVRASPAPRAAAHRG